MDDNEKLTKKEKETCDNVISAFKKKFETEYIDFEAVRVETMTPFESKIGGTPYLPKDFEYPCSTINNSQGKPMKLLAQLNFEELPKLEHFPQKGILQFYIAFDEENDFYGADFDYPTKQDGFRIVYHSNISENECDLQAPPEFSKESEVYLPFEGEFKIVATKEKDFMGCGDFRFEKGFLPIYNEISGEHEEEYFNLPDEMIDYFWENLINEGHKVGGYADFTQTDPREYKTDLQNHTALLLQIDSDEEIMWGDCGIANFFIKPEDLEKCNFSNVVYNWDCC